LNTGFAVVSNRLKSSFRREVDDRTVLLTAATAVFLIASWPIVRTAACVPMTEWMLIYSLNDFQDFGDLFAYMRHLNTGIPPVLSFVEIAVNLLLGDFTLVTKHFYRLCIILSFVIPFLLFARSTVEIALRYVLSFVFLWSTVIVTWRNPALYDILLPLLILLYVVFVEMARAETQKRYLSMSFCFLAGFFLSVAELSRPYVLVILPFLLLCTYQALKHVPRKYFVWFMLPILLLSGGWHAKLLILHNGQIIWSNHGGYNLQACWMPVVKEYPPLLDEEDMNDEGNIPGFVGTAPWPTPSMTKGNPRLLANGRWPNLNTVNHSRNSSVLAKHTIKHIIRHPIQSTAHLLRRIAVVLKPRTKLWEGSPLSYDPKHPILHIYRPFVWVSSAFLILNAVFLGVYVLRTRNLRVLALPESPLLIFACLSILFIAAGHPGEESRYIVSILPCFAALPRVFSVCISRTAHGAKRWSITALGPEETRLGSDKE